MNLDNKNISATVENVRAFFEKSKVPRKEIIKICLIMEEILLRYQTQFGEEREFEISTKNWFDMPRVTIKIPGEPFYPPHQPTKNKNELDETILSEDIMMRLFDYNSTKIAYRYDGKYNETNFFAKKEIKSMKIPGGSITVSIILAVISSIIFGFFPQDFQNILMDSIVAPTLSTLMSLIITVTIFMMFFSIVSSICAIDDSSTLENIGKTVIGRFFLLDCFIILLTMAASYIFFPIKIISADEGAVNFDEIVALFLSIVPINIVEAFAKANILQVTVLAFLVGFSVIILGNRVANLKNMFIDLNAVIFKVMEIVFKTIPLVIFLCIFKTFVTSNFSDFFIVWKLVVAAIISFGTITLIMLILASLKSKLKIIDFMKKIYPAVLICVTTLSSIAAIPKTLEVAKNNLHIEEKFSSFWVPLATALLSPSVMIKIVTSAFYVLEVSGGTVSIMQLIIIIFLSIQLGIASPKVAGGIAASFTILLTQLGLPLELIGVLMIANIITDNVFAAFCVIFNCCELTLVSHKLNFIKSK